MTLRVGCRWVWGYVLLWLPAVALAELPVATYGVPEQPWADGLGNHRAVVAVQQAEDAVWVRIPWRRRDEQPEQKDILVVDAATKKRVVNRIPVVVNRDFGDLLFQPPTVPGEYFVYYMPYALGGWQHFPVTNYTAPSETADAAWKEKIRPLAQRIAAGKTDGIATAQVKQLQAINDFHRFDPMEVVATADEVQSLLSQHAGQAYLVFPEDRLRPIRMLDALPHCWTNTGPKSRFAGEACRGESFAFQLGVFAAAQDLTDLKLQFNDLRTDSGAVIPATALRCVNTGGTDWLGRRVVKQLDVAQGCVQPLWVLIDVAPDAQPGVYRGQIVVSTGNATSYPVNVHLTVSQRRLADGGENDLWRQTRLKWLDSTIGLDDELVEPFTAVGIDGQTVRVLGRSIRFGEDGLLESIQSTFGASVDHTDSAPRELLTGPMRLAVETADGPNPWQSGGSKIIARSSGAVTWEAKNTAGPLRLAVHAKMECDGYINFQLELQSEVAMPLDDVQLLIPVQRDVAKYFMGLGRKGGLRPTQWKWKWDPKFANSYLWIGDVNAGFQCKLKHIDDRWDLYNMQAVGVYEPWGNGGQGGCDVTEQGDTVLIRAYTGPRSLGAGQKLCFKFGMLLTPFRTLDKGHWHWRYLHGGVPTIDQAVKQGANLINIHHGNVLNPHINYPFIANQQLKHYTTEARERGVKVKMYYTVRELSNYVAELWALRSLGSEVFTNGPDFKLADHFLSEKPDQVADPKAMGHAWLREHLKHNYVGAWHQPLGPGVYDASIATQGLSRWHNYYLEGLRWLVQETGVTGLYLDGVGYDREIMKRVRKVLQRSQPGCLIDFHSGNNFAPQYGLNNCAAQYMELLPYVDSIWFGEGFDYNESPEYYLVEIAGIPFGLFGEMLHGGGNPWRGMVYGMTPRLGWSGDPRPTWKLWDEFGIDRAKMYGYWDPDCPVRTNHPDVLATAYVREGQILVALASWAAQPVQCQLVVDWQRLGLDPGSARFTAPEVANFQEARIFAVGDPLSVEPGKGWMLLIE